MDSARRIMLVGRSLPNPLPAPKVGGSVKPAARAAVLAGDAPASLFRTAISDGDGKDAHRGGKLYRHRHQLPPQGGLSLWQRHWYFARSESTLVGYVL